jgi:hypothetical protein
VQSVSLVERLFTSSYHQEHLLLLIHL